MMKVKAVKPFFDKGGVTRLTGDSFAMTKERYKELVKTASAYWEAVAKNRQTKRTHETG